VLVSTPDRFADLVRRGRVRYVVTLGPKQAAEVGRDTLDEMVIAARSVAALPGEFAPCRFVLSRFSGVGAGGEDMDLHLGVSASAA
jgi:hypothetical protein